MGVTPSGRVEETGGRGPRPCSREGTRGDDIHTDGPSIIVTLIYLLTYSLTNTNNN